jgi:cobalamin biosynthesis protein CobD/CbiB
MSLFSILCVLVLEQIKAFPADRLTSAQAVFAAWVERQFNGGEKRHGMAAWVVGVLAPSLLVFLLQLFLCSLHPVLAFIFGAAVLYAAMGFRQFSHYFTDIQLALRMGEIDRARRLIGAWTASNAEHLGSRDIARLSIEQGILSSHRHVFAPMLWFVVAGPAGAVLYRLAWGMMQRWTATEPEEGGTFSQFAREAFQWIDWLPARLTAVTFAIVGDFEDAVYCWRTQAGQWADAATGILLASGAGALGVRLGLPLPEAAGVELRPELGLGDDADVEHLQSAIGLVWRAMVLSLLLLALLTLASWLG